MVCYLLRTTLFFRTPVHRHRRKLIVLRDLTDAWNEVRFTIIPLLVGANMNFTSDAHCASK